MIHRYMLYFLPLLLANTKLYADTAATIVTPAQIITQANLPFTISTAGVYWLESDLTYAPGVTGTNAISIAASDVTLDLKEHSITQTNTTGNTNGILVTGNFSDIVIRNGTLSGFQRAGAGVGTVATPVTAQRIKINNISITNCLVSGINIIGLAAPNRSRNIFIENCSLGLCGRNITAGTSNQMISCSNVDSVYVTKTTVTNCGISTIPATSTLRAIVGSNVNNFYISNVDIGGNLGGLGRFFGIFLSNCINVRVTNSTCNNNTAAAISGIDTGSIGASRNVLLHQCELANNVATTDMRVTQLTGNVVARECVASRNQVTGSSFRGFDCISANNLVLNCVSSRNLAAIISAVNPAYSLDGTTAVASGIIGCISDNNILSEAYYLFGNLGTTPLRCLVRDCLSIADSNIGFNFNAVLNPASTSTVLRCMVVKTPTPYVNFPAGSIQQAPDISGINGLLLNSWTNISLN